MYKRLNLYKDKLPKRKRRVSDDDVYIKGMYNPFLDTTGYEVEDLRESGITTAEKGVLADYPDFEGIGWIFDSEIKDYESLLKDRRSKMTQTFRYMLKQNSITSPSEPSEPSSMSSGLPNNISRSTSKSSHTSEPRPSQMMEDLRRVANFFGFGGGANEDEDDEENEEAQASNKNIPTPPQSSSSSSSSRHSNNPALPVYQTVTPPESIQSSRPRSVRSSPPQSVRSSPPQSVQSSRRSSNSARPSTVLSSSTSLASTIDYGFNQ